MSNQKRQPAGVPAGGQFDNNEHDEAKGALFPEPEYVTMSPNDIADAVRSAEGSLVWSSSEVEMWQMDNEGDDVPDFHPDSSEYLRAEIDDFADAYPELVHAAEQSGYSSTDGSGFAGAFGHDFVMERSGSGVGFYDREQLRFGNLGEVISRRMNARDTGLDVVVGDDGLLHVEPGKYAREQTEATDKVLETLTKAHTDGGDSPRDAALKAQSHLKASGQYRYLSYKARRSLDDALGLSFDRDEDDE